MILPPRKTPVFRSVSSSAQKASINPDSRKAHLQLQESHQASKICYAEPPPAATQRGKVASAHTFCLAAPQPTLRKKFHSVDKCFFKWGHTSFLDPCNSTVGGIAALPWNPVRPMKVSTDPSGAWTSSHCKIFRAATPPVGPDFWTLLYRRWMSGHVFRRAQSTR